MLTKEQIAEAIRLTDAQKDALGNLHAAWQECRKLKIDFVFDEELYKIVGVHVPDNIEMQYDDSFDEDTPSQSYTLCSLADDEVMMEVGDTCYKSDDYGRISWIEKKPSSLIL